MINESGHRHTRSPASAATYRIPRVALLLVALSTTSAALAQPWDSLSQQQREVLAPFSAEWTNFDQAQRQHLLASAQLWASLNPEERSRLAENLRAWQSLDAETRNRLRELRQDRQRLRNEFQRLPPAQQRSLLRRDWMRNLPAPQRQKLIRGSRALSADERRQLREQLTNLPSQKRIAWLDELLSSESEAEFLERALRGPSH